MYSEPTTVPETKDFVQLKQTVRRFASRRSYYSDSDVMEDPLANPPLDERAYESQRVPSLTMGNGAPLVTRASDGSHVAWALQVVAAPPMFEPDFLAIPTKRSALIKTTVPRHSRDTTPAFSKGVLREDSTDGTNGNPRLTQPGSSEKRWIKHTLSSGLMIEVEARPTSLVESESERTSEPTSHTSVVVRTQSPESPHVDDAYSQGDKSEISVYTYPEEWPPPRQPEGSYFFETYLEEFETTSLVESESERTSEPTSHTSVVVRTQSPESPHGDDAYSQGDEISVYTYPEEWPPPRQGGDRFFEQYLEELEMEQLRPFYQGDLWRLKFIPTLLMFLGTRSNPWDWSGSELVTLLRQIWSIVYDEPSWADEDGDRVYFHAAESVTAWFCSFASNALTAVESFLKQFTDGPPEFSYWSGICEEIMRDGRMFYKHPDGPRSSGLFDTVFVLAPLSGHLRAIRGGTQVEPQSSSDSAYPFGAIGLAATAAFRAVLLFRKRLVRYDADGKLYINTSFGDGAGALILSTEFSKETAGGRTRQCALFACNLMPSQLDYILSHVDPDNFVGTLPPTQEAFINSDDE